MKTSKMLLGVLIAFGASAEKNGAGQREVKVCIDGSADVQTIAATEAVSRIFLKIGVGLNWRSDPRRCAGPEQGIVITLAENAPADDHRNALAYAMPYERSTVVVFLDRVKARRFPFLLTYVLAHEIAHMLQGIVRHSEVGILRPVWRAEEYFDMRRGKLTFTEEDVQLIHLAVDVRRSLRTLSSTTK